MSKIFFVSTFLLGSALGNAQTAAKVWEAPLVLPTYELGPPDTNPRWMAGVDHTRNPVYPYTMLDSLTDHRVNKSWKAVYLENEYLRVTVLPEMGGKLYSIFDKTSNREILYTNHVVKYGIVAIRGAWTSGGIEWNFPNGHTVSTVSPIDYAIRTEPDGAASVTVGDTERIQRMEWAITIRLRPGWKAVETEVTLNNRRDIPGRYWYWATGAAPATEDLRFIYPMREAYPHAFWPVFTFPKYNGVDVGTYREVPSALSLFARNSMRDFMCVYYEKADNGVVHVADHRIVPGKKTWTWGADDSGRIWIEKLTDKDGQYVEFQAGRFETQMEHQFLAPRMVEHFTEYWYPVNGLGGGLDEANRFGAVHVKRDGAKTGVAINVNTGFHADVRVIGKSGPASQAADLDPAVTKTLEFELKPGDESEPVTVEIARDGKTVLTWRSDEPVDGNPNFKPATRPAPKSLAPNSAEEAYARAIPLDKDSREFEARAAYEKAMERDPSYAPARVGLGVFFLRTGAYEKAAAQFAAALKVKDSGEAHYYLGLARRAEGRNGEAVIELKKAIGGWREAPIRSMLGEIALASGDTNTALDELGAAARLEEHDLKTRTTLALAERIAGKLDSAQSHIDSVLQQVPVDYLALRERELILKAKGNDTEAARANAEVWRVLGREPDSALELAFDYSAIGRRPEAIAVLEEARAHYGYAMIPYTLGYLYGLGGDAKRAAGQYAAGAKADPTYVFPHRPEEIGVLRAARAANPKDGRAAYYLGNALMGNAREDEAIAAWHDAVKLEPSNAVAHRNLAAVLAPKSDKATRQEGLQEYRRAIEIAPDNWHLYTELASALRSDAAARIALLEGAPQLVGRRPPVLEALAAAYADASRFEDALKLLASAEFTAGEGESGAYQIYRRSHLGLAAKYRAANDRGRAGTEVLLACEYPRNLGVGKPSTGTDARDLVAAARDFEAANMPEKANEAWRLAAEGDVVSPVDPGARLGMQHVYRALALEHTGRKDESRAIYDRLANAEREPLPPTGPELYLLKGIGLKNLGRTAEARTEFEECLKLNSQNRMCKAELEKGK